MFSVACPLSCVSSVTAQSVISAWASPSATPRLLLNAVMHTSCSLTINENASPDVPLDMEDSLNRMVPEVGSARFRRSGSAGQVPLQYATIRLAAVYERPVIFPGALHCGIKCGTLHAVGFPLEPAPLLLLEPAQRGCHLFERHAPVRCCPVFPMQGDMYRHLDEGYDDMPGKV